MNELPDNLARALAALDAEAARAAAKVDGARVADAVLKRLRAEPLDLVPRPLWQLRTVRVAAAAVLLVVAGVGIHRLTVGFADVAELPIVAQADLLDVGQLRDMLTAVDDARQAGNALPAASTVTLDDLNEQELLALLTVMNTAEGT